MFSVITYLYLCVCVCYPENIRYPFTFIQIIIQVWKKQLDLQNKTFPGMLLWENNQQQML